MAGTEVASTDDMDALVQLTWRVHDILDDVARAHDLSTSQLRLFGILRDREPEMLELAGYLGVDKSSVSGLIDRAEARGLVERVPSATDRRRVAVRLTATGRAQRSSLEAAVYSAIERAGLTAP